VGRLVDRATARQAQIHRLHINPVIRAELSLTFSTVELEGWRRCKSP
jgi:hypothetical protein